MLSAQHTSGNSSAGKQKGKEKARNEELQNIHRAFDVIDKDQSGEVDKHEVRPGLFSPRLQNVGRAPDWVLVASSWRSYVWS